MGWHRPSHWTIQSLQDDQLDKERLIEKEEKSDATLIEIEMLSDEEAEALLLAELSDGKEYK